AQRPPSGHAICRTTTSRSTRITGRDPVSDALTSGCVHFTRNLISMTQLEQFLTRAEALLGRLEAFLPPALNEPDWNASVAFRWRKSNGRGWLQPVAHLSPIALDDLHNIGPQKDQIEQNTRQFVDGKPANNVLLTGARGTGKSSLIKACLN